MIVPISAADPHAERKEEQLFARARRVLTGTWLAQWCGGRGEQEEMTSFLNLFSFECVWGADCVFNLVVDKGDVRFGSCSSSLEVAASSHTPPCVLGKRGNRRKRGGGPSPKLSLKIERLRAMFILPCLLRRASREL